MVLEKINNLETKSSKIFAIAERIAVKFLNLIKKFKCVFVSNCCCTYDVERNENSNNQENRSQSVNN